MEELHLEGEFQEFPITFRDLAELDRSIANTYAFLRTMEDSEFCEDLKEVLNFASDSLCNLCYEMNIDPNILSHWSEDNEDIIVTPFEPSVPE